MRVGSSALTLRRVSEETVSAAEDEAAETFPRDIEWENDDDDE